MAPQHVALASTSAWPHHFYAVIGKAWSYRRHRHHGCDRADHGVRASGEVVGYRPLVVLHEQGLHVRDRPSRELKARRNLRHADVQ